MRTSILLASSITVFSMLTLASLALGPAGVKSPLDYIDGLGGVELYRLLRTSASIVVGASLAVSGASLQQALRNPLVDPYLLGISTGASLAVALSLLLGLAGPLGIGSAALAGGLAAFLLVLVTARLAGMTGSGLIIVGVAYSYLFGSLTTLLVLSFPDRLTGALYWIFGSVAYVDRGILATAAGGLGLAAIYLAASSKALEALSLGEEAARGLGIAVERLRAWVATASIVAVAASVALAGPVGFIGLTAPWIARLLGASRFQQVLLASAPLGAGLALASDILARTLASPAELPLTPIASLIGVPILVYAAVERWRGVEAL
ncbi:FecCD family ABC transporter permease [Aeropyrum camini]|uniref:ABC transporter permease n=1 Tax=Aeropyrum camini SY1 = JCM 12091 TaxID=1198449 RepID=U3TFS5_9CREN|nr:iron ABC transporter permease [Aeropyrum camini]BAN90154.1 ABC transporter permease [Aeropyrum camini SY1 = JCM 12091]